MAAVRIRRTSRRGNNGIISRRDNNLECPVSAGIKPGDLAHGISGNHDKRCPIRLIDAFLFSIGSDNRTPGAQKDLSHNPAILSSRGRLCPLQRRIRAWGKFTMGAGTSNSTPIRTDFRLLGAEHIFRDAGRGQHNRRCQTQNQDGAIFLNHTGIVAGEGNRTLVTSLEG